MIPEPIQKVTEPGFAGEYGDVYILRALGEMSDEISRYCAEIGIDGAPSGREMEEMLELLKLRRRLNRLAVDIVLKD